ncbi:MAG: hypothetical protein HRT69_15455 [Flavobacteriaceae bacterium]|nr:hypothetical protein [Flavobacteriaceae bacterium]
MKNVYIILLLVTTNLFSQAPEGFNYQAAIRDGAGDILVSQAVGMQFSIRQGSAGGSVVYTETFNTTTSALGLVDVVIGTGTTTDNFTTLDWSNGPYFLETAVDITGGTTYIVLGISQLMSTPYSLYANTATTSEDAIQRGTPGQTTYYDGSDWVGTSHLFNNGSRIGIGTPAPGYDLEVFNNDDQAILALNNGNTSYYPNQIVFENRTTMQWSISGPRVGTEDFNFYRRKNGTYSLALSIGSDGYFGILTDDPTKALDVDGEVRIRGGNPEYGKVLIATDTNGNTAWSQLGDTDEDSTERIIDAGSSNLWVDVANNDITPIVSGKGTYLVFVTFRFKIAGGSGDDSVEFRLRGTRLTSSGSCSSAGTVTSDNTGELESYDDHRNKWNLVSFHKAMTFNANSSCNYKIFLQVNTGSLLNDPADDDFHFDDLSISAIRISD